MNKIERTHILGRIGEEDVISLAQKIWHNQQLVATKIASEALDIISETYQANPTFFGGKSAKGIVGGLFYLLGHQYNSIKTQREIARSLNATEVTIRASYREWVKPSQSYFRRGKKE